jgi:hypothetical protein
VWRGIRLGMCALLAITLTGMFSAGDTAVRLGQPPQYTGGASPIEARQIILPFDTYRLNVAESPSIDQTLVKLETQCMRAHGFTDITIPAVAAKDNDEPWNARRYGIVGQATAKEFGYHLPRSPQRERSAAQLGAWRTALTQPERVALYGPSGDTGCAATAADRITRGVAPDNAGWLTKFDFTSLDQSRTDPRLQATTRDWQTCMSRQELRYANPDQAIQDPQWDLNSPTPSDDEVSTAVADARCKDQTDLVRVWMTVETEIQQDIIKKNSGRFAERAKTIQLILANARSLAAQ